MGEDVGREDSASRSLPGSDAQERCRPAEHSGGKPKIYAFSNGGSPGWYYAVALAEDGHVLGDHLCSHEGYIPGDLGVTPGSRPDRHEGQYSKHYPDGYEMEFVPHAQIAGHAGLQAAIAANAALPDEAPASSEAPPLSPSEASAGNLPPDAPISLTKEA